MEELIRENRYEFPAISTSDSTVSNIDIVDNTVCFKFKNTGFWVKNSIDDCFRRSKESSLTMYECDLENIDVFLIIDRSIDENKYHVKEYIEFRDFVKKINNGIWSFEIIQDYRYSLGSLFVGRVRGNEIKADCYLQIEWEKYGLYFI